MIIGITGSIGSGKTTVAKLFSRHWYNRIDADKIGHETIKNNSIVYKKIVKEFGIEILDKNENIDRNRLGDVVFSDNKKLEKLNLIIRPTILKEIKNKINKIKNRCGDKTKIVIDAPLLLETKTKNLVDKIVVVKCDKGKIFDRLSQKFSKNKIEKILNIQMPLKEKLKHADFTIDNNKDLKHLEKQVMGIIKKLS